jgi:hypothetical protein
MLGIIYAVYDIMVHIIVYNILEFWIFYLTLTFMVWVSIDTDI